MIAMPPISSGAPPRSSAVIRKRGSVGPQGWAATARHRPAHRGRGTRADHAGDLFMPNGLRQGGRIFRPGWPQQQSGGPREHHSTTPRHARRLLHTPMTGRRQTPQAVGRSMKKGSRGDPSPFFAGFLRGTRVTLVGNPARLPDYSAAAASSTEQNLRPSLPSWNATRPSTSANRVWSLPMPTLRPG